MNRAPTPQGTRDVAWYGGLSPVHYVDLVSATSFCLKHRAIGDTYEGVDFVARLIGGNAKAGGNVNAGAGHGEFSGVDSLSKLFGNRRSAGECDVRQTDQELLAAPARADVLFPNTLFQLMCHMNEDDITCLMTMLIVHSLEMVDVGEDHGEHLVVPLGPTDLCGERFEHFTTVREPGERVLSRRLVERIGQQLEILLDAVAQPRHLLKAPQQRCVVFPEPQKVLVRLLATAGLIGEQHRL